MKRPSRFPLAAFLALLPFGLGAQIVLGNGRPETELRSLPAFRSLAFACPGELRVRRGSTQEVRLTVDSNVLPLIRTEVSGGRLEISFKPRSGAIKSKKLLVEVSMPELEAIELAGSADRARLRLTGSGGLAAELSVAESLDVTMRGSGSASYRGSPRVESSISGSGRLRRAGD